MEGLTGLEGVAMRLPGDADRFGVRQVPATKAKMLLMRQTRAIIITTRGIDEPQFRILFPVPVR